MDLAGLEPAASALGAMWGYLLSETPLAFTVLYPLSYRSKTSFSFKILAFSKSSKRSSAFVTGRAPIRSKAGLKSNSFVVPLRLVRCMNLYAPN